MLPDIRCDVAIVGGGLTGCATAYALAAAGHRVALVEAWGNLHDRNRRVFENMPDSGPRERLAVMMQTLVAPQHWALERSMRLWALTDEATRASVERSDGRVLEADFRRAGFTRVLTRTELKALGTGAKAPRALLGLFHLSTMSVAFDKIGAGIYSDELVGDTAQLMRDQPMLEDMTEAVPRIACSMSTACTDDFVAWLVARRTVARRAGSVSPSSACCHNAHDASYR